MDLKAYSFIWLSVSDNPSLYSINYTLKLPFFNLNSQKTDYFQFKSEVRGRNSITSGELTGLYCPS